MSDFIGLGKMSGNHNVMDQPSPAEQRDAEDSSKEETAGGPEPNLQPVAEMMKKEAVSRGADIDTVPSA